MPSWLEREIAEHKDGVPGRQHHPNWPTTTTIRTIYVASTGSDDDAEADGTEALPYDTFQRGSLDLPPVVDRNERWVIDLGDALGTETFPAGWIMPTVKAAVQLDQAIASSVDSWNRFRGAVMVKATPKTHSIGLTDATFTSADITGAAPSADADTGHYTFTLSTPRASWAANALRGAILRSSVTSIVGQTDCRVVSSSSTVLVVSLSSQSPGAGGSAIVPTGPWTIMEESATFTGPSNTSLGGNGPFNVFNVDSFSFAGINFVNSGGVTSPCIVVRSSSPAWAFMNCKFSGRAGFQGGGSYLGTFENCYWYGGGATEFMGIGGSFRKCLFYGVTAWNTTPQDGALWLQGCVFDACAPVLKAAGYGGLPSTQQTFPTTQKGQGSIVAYLTHCLVQNGTSHGIEISSGTVIQYSKVTGCAGDGIRVDGARAPTRLVKVKGSSNTGYGLNVQGLSFVERDSNTTITGTLGDYKVGANVAAAAAGAGWTALGSTGMENDFHCSEALVFADATFTAANATDIITFGAAHSLMTGDGPFQVSNAGGALPTGLTAVTDYWFIKVTTTTGKLAASWANALAGIAVDITADGTGTQTMADTTLTKTSPGARSLGCLLVTN